MCKLNPDAGTCRGYNIRWYYDASVQRCQRFVHTGCDGNDNRFDSEDECMDFCGSGVDTVITPAPTQPSGGELHLHVHGRRAFHGEVLYLLETIQTSSDGWCTTSLVVRLQLVVLALLLRSFPQQLHIDKRSP